MCVVLQRDIGLVTDDVVGHQLQANHEGVVAGLVVGRDAGHAECPARIHAIGAYRAADAGETADQNAAGKVGGQRATVCGGGDDLITQPVIERCVQTHARRDQIIDAQSLCGAFRQGDHDVVAHAFADHQVATGGVTGTGIAIVQRAVGEDFGDDRRRDLLVGEVGQVGGGEVGAAVDAGVVAQGRGGLQGAAGFDRGADYHVVTDDYHIGAAGVGGGAAAPGEEGRLTTGIEEGDLVAGHAVIGAQHQQRTVATINLQVRRRQAAANEAQAGRQGDAGADIVGTAAASVFNRCDQP
ncbi:hypothetical protein D3C85_1058350 [compost metagenome]